MSSTTDQLYITGEQFDRMVDRGAFAAFPPGKIELIHGEIRIMNPAGPVHDDLIEYLDEWSHVSRSATEFRIRVQCSIVVADNRPEPDIAWLAPATRRVQRPTAADIRLLIEVADSSLATDLREKADLYAAGGIAEYWIVDVPNRRIHVMAQPAGGSYQDLRLVPRGQHLSPLCHPSAVLDTGDLFDFEAEQV